MAKVSRVTVGGPWDNTTDDTVDWVQEQIDAMDKLQDVSDALPDSELVGYIYSYPVVDGYAYYRVSKLSPLTLEHIPFLDGYQLGYAHINGLNKAQLSSHRKHTRAIKALFSRRSAEREEEKEEEEVK